MMTSASPPWPRERALRRAERKAGENASNNREPRLHRALPLCTTHWIACQDHPARAVRGSAFSAFSAARPPRNFDIAAPSAGDSGQPFPDGGWYGCNRGRLRNPPRSPGMLPCLEKSSANVRRITYGASRTGTERPAEPHQGKAPLSTEHHTPPQRSASPGQSAASVF